MVAQFYRRHGARLLIAVALSFPFLHLAANGLRSDNDIETWLPSDSPARAAYDDFRRHFGPDETILVSLPVAGTDSRLIEAFAARLEELPTIRKCWTAARVSTVMEGLGAAPADTRKQLEGLLLSPDGKTTGVAVLLNEKGIDHRDETVAAVREQLAYCQLNGPDVALTGTPVIVSELDVQGGFEANTKFFLITLVFCLGLLYFSIGHWGLTLGILGLTVWGMDLTLASLRACGMEVNFILGALPVMVMIFTLSIAIHFLSYYTSAIDDEEPSPLDRAIRQAAWPCFLATLTTLLGLVSLTASGMQPVCEFGLGAGLGAVIACIVGLGVTPALLVIWPAGTLRAARHDVQFAGLGAWVARRSGWIVGVAGVLCCLGAWGAMRLRTELDAVRFLPQNNPVVTDLRQVERELTNIDGVEAVVDFGPQPQPFLERLERVRMLESRLRQHPAVRHCLSLASFFPAQLPEQPLAIMRMLRNARELNDDNEYLAEGDRLWRISLRIRRLDEEGKTALVGELRELAGDSRVSFTGLAPLLTQAQQQIFLGFWDSLSTAFLVISGVMVLAFWSFRVGVLAMLPNVAPLVLVFGFLGLCGLPVDIGMMMTGSIALGIAVDGTFHFLMRYQAAEAAGAGSKRSAWRALRQTGEPILNAAVVGSVGMLALSLSNFVPTARFGWLMAALLVAALVGDLVLLPALFCLRPREPQPIPLPLKEPAAIPPVVAPRAGLKERVA